MDLIFAEESTMTLIQNQCSRAENLQVLHHGKTLTHQSKLFLQPDKNQHEQMENLPTVLLHTQSSHSISMALEKPSRLVHKSIEMAIDSTQDCKSHFEHDEYGR